MPERGRSCLTLRIAVLGVGEFGRLHAEAVSRLGRGQLVAVCDANPSRAQAVARATGARWVFTDPFELWHSSDIDAVIIATPEACHYEQIRSALRAGKHVLAEKPIALRASEAWELYGLAQQAQRVLMPGHTLRFAPEYNELRRMLGKPHSGRVRSVFARRNVPRTRFALHQRTHAVLMALSHDIDLALWYLRSAPVRSYGVQRRTDGEFGNPDVFFGIVEFSDGAVFALESVWLVPEGAGCYIDSELEVITDQTMYRVRIPNDGFTAITSERTQYPDIFLLTDVAGHLEGALARELEHFIACATGEISPVVTAADAARALEVAESLIRSAEEGRPVNVASVGSGGTES